MTPQKRLTQALADPLLAPLLEQHFARVHAAFLRDAGSAEGSRTPVARDRQGYARHLANLLQREHGHQPDVRTLVINERQRRILAEAVGEAPRGDDVQQLAAMLRASADA